MTQTQLQSTALDPAGDSRWISVGRSSATDSFAAGAEATSTANVNPDVALYLVFAGHRHDHEALVAGVASVATPDASVMGCSTGGEVGVGGPTAEGVVVMALGGAGVSVATRSADIVGGDLRTATEQVASAIWDIEDRGNTVLMVLSDGLAGDQEDVVKGAYATTGPSIPLVGGCAGDGLETTSTTLFHADRHGSRIGGGQVIAAAISSTGPIGIGMFHGWRPAGDTVLVTKSIGNVIHEIDEEPALDRYLRIHQAPADLADDADAFSVFAASHPIGISRRGGEEVRLILSADPTARTVTAFSAVPQGVVAFAMEGTNQSVVDAAEAACEDALSQLDGPALGVVAFDCVARRGLRASGELADDVHRIEERLAAPIAGFYTYGEFARVTGSSGFHNQTLVTLAIG